MLEPERWHSRRAPHTLQHPAPFITQWVSHQSPQLTTVGLVPTSQPPITTTPDPLSSLTTLDPPSATIKPTHQISSFVTTPAPWRPPPYVPPPSWPTTLVLLLSWVVAGVGGKGGPAVVVMPQDQLHRGDLHLVRGPNVHPLAWVVELAPSCTLAQLTASLRAPCTTHTRMPTDSQKYPKKANKAKDRGRTMLKRECCSSDILKLIVLKKLSFLEDTYVVAHPYLKFYSSLKRRRRQAHRIRLVNSSRATPGREEEGDEAVFRRVEGCVEGALEAHPCVRYVQQDVLRTRHKRSVVHFEDPLYQDQWHLRNQVMGQYDLNVEGVWESGVTGRGVTVCVIDDGLEWRHPDLRHNYNPAGSYDLNSDDADPSPIKNGEHNEHGTRCAGEIAAGANQVCGVGVAYRASISGVRVLGGRMTDSMEAQAFIQGLDSNHIYSCSWGPDDDGQTVDGPHQLARRALEHGITYGRGGYGAIYVVASGNGGSNKDNCNFDGYANSVFTVTIGAVDIFGRMPYYAEECAAMLAVAPSSGSSGKDIVTTDWSEVSATGCTHHHSGTSAAAPLVAAVIALALEVQPCLSWRDVQYIIALTSRKIDVGNSDWVVNGAGLHHSHQHGFGLVDAEGAVAAAAVWESVPFATTYSSPQLQEEQLVPATPSTGPLKVSHTITPDVLAGYGLHTLEFVQVVVNVEHEYRGSLRIVLQCPSGTHSILATPRHADNSSRGLVNWALGTVRCWGEEAAGQYQLTLRQTLPHRTLTGRLRSWQLILHGSPLTPLHIQQRRSLVERALRGHVRHVNRSSLCHPPALHFQPFQPLPDRWLKVLAITGFFLLLMAIFNSIEYVFCYNDEKEKFYQKLRELEAGRALHLRSAHRAHNPYGSLQTPASSATTTIDAPASSNEALPLMLVEREAGPSSPSPSCEADVSSCGGDSEDNLSSHCTNDTLLPRDTDATDATNDDLPSEPDETTHLDTPLLIHPLTLLS